MSTTEHYDPVARETVEVRRNAGLAALIGVLAAAVAIAWLGRATQSGAALDWIVVAVMAVIAAGWLASFVDARSPLLVADGHGVRIRLGHAWQGLPWDALASVEHHPRQAWWRDGVLALEPSDVDQVLEEADSGVRRRAWLNRRLHGAPLAVPIGLATRTVGAGDDLTATLRRLAQGATAVVVAEPAAEVVEHVEDVEDDVTGDDGIDWADGVGVIDDAADEGVLVFERIPEAAFGDEILAEEERAATREAAIAVDEVSADVLAGADVAPAAGFGLRAKRRVARMIESRREAAVAREEVVAEVEADLAFAEADTQDSIPAVDPVRPLVQARRSEVHHEVEEVRPVAGRELRRDGRVSLVEESGAEPTVVLGGLDEVSELDEVAQVAPRPEPVIGPVLTRARERIGLSVDALAERTRIRPHVIEAIEVDDFGPCGGDFYARGHLRTLGRILGLEAGPLVNLYDERYSDAPINARKVFEAELATGTGGIRAVRGGPNWSVVVAAVMAVILAWSVAKLAMDDKPEPDGVMSLSQGSGGPNGSGQQAQRVTIKVTATGSTAVKIKNAKGRVVFSEELATGDIHRVDVVPPVKVEATDAGAVEVEIDNVPQGTVGKAGQAGSKKFTG